MVKFGGRQFIVAYFVDIDSSIPVFNEWNANEHLRKSFEMDGKEGGR